MSCLSEYKKISGWQYYNLEYLLLYKHVICNDHLEDDLIFFLHEFSDTHACFVCSFMFCSMHAWYPTRTKHSFTSFSHFSPVPALLPHRVCRKSVIIMLIQHKTMKFYQRLFYEYQCWLEECAITFYTTSVSPHSLKAVWIIN